MQCAVRTKVLAESLGPSLCHEMVLGTSSGRRCVVGDIRDVQGWRERYDRAPAQNGCHLTKPDSGMARDAFTNFIPISVDSNARVRIITDFFELIAAVAAHGKTNGLGGHKLSRFAGWWAFGHIDTGKGFDAGYRSWERFERQTT